MVHVGDDESRAIGRYLVPQLSAQEWQSFLEQHIATAGYRLKSDDDASVTEPDQHYHANDSLWEAIIYSSVPPLARVRLNSFFLFEWLPRAPGLYFTHDGYMARQEAKAQIA